jgi:hypothetical protein
VAVEALAALSACLAIRRLAQARRYNFSSKQLVISDLSNACQK